MFHLRANFMRIVNISEKQSGNPEDPIPNQYRPFICKCIYLHSFIYTHSVNPCSIMLTFLILVNIHRNGCQHRIQLSTVDRSHGGDIRRRRRNVGIRVRSAGPSQKRDVGEDQRDDQRSRIVSNPNSERNDAGD